MKRLIICFLIGFAALSGPVSAGEVRSIELDDGSVIYGEILGLNSGVFTIKSKTLGTVEIKASEIRNIHMKPGSGASGEQLQELRQSMKNDPNILDMIFSLQDDPDVQAILQDPDLMKSLNAGDIETLMSNPKIIKLLSNPKIQAIGKKALK